MPVPKASYAREQTGDPKLDRMQAELGRLRAILARCPFVDGALVENVDLTTSTTLVPHRLGRTPKGFLVVGAASSFAGAVAFAGTQPEDTRMVVNMTASTVLTVSLWFW